MKQQYEAMNETKKISIPSDLIGNLIGKNGCRVQQIQDTYNVKIHTKFQKRSIQDIKLIRNEHQANVSLNEIKKIVTCANYLNKTCYYGKHCKFLHYSLQPKVINNEKRPTMNLIKITRCTLQNNNKNKKLDPNKKETQMNNQQVELNEQLTQLIKQESVEEMLQTTMISTLTKIISTATL